MTNWKQICYLNLVKVLASFKWHNIVCRDSYHRFICGILGCVKCQCSFSWHNLRKEKNSCVRVIFNINLFMWLIE